MMLQTLDRSLSKLGMKLPRKWKGSKTHSPLAGTMQPSKLARELNMETEISNAFQAFGAVATSLAFLIGLLVYRSDSTFKRNDLLARQAILSLERAWDIFTDRGKASRPKADRVIWLTTARHLERFVCLRSLMHCPDAHKIVLDEHEEYWRYRFYDFLHPICLENGFYDQIEAGRKIEPRSAFVIVKFSGWSGVQDPIDRVMFAEEDLDDLKKHPVLSEYLRSYLRGLKQ
ncbi:hypothetical protein ACFWP0_08140 [Achromobacter sp. NPDC058515]|uniref:hypothetical protein n=1 Tax=Achromobacter sp. NPDC058515 TaxID=3346533 RepID=UPI003651543B